MKEITELRKQLISFLKKEYPELDINENLIFGSYDNLRLTCQGCQLLSSKFEHHKFNIDKDFKFTPNAILNLAKINKPFYYNRTMIILFGQEDYVSLALMGDINLWISSLT